MTYDKRSYTSGHFELAIDGHSKTAYLKSLEGGFVSGAPIEEPMGSENARVKHLSTVDIEPFTFEMAMSGSKDVLQWISNSWDKQYMRRNGQITHADFNLKNQLEHHFTEALIMETTFPTLDGSAKDAAYLKMKVQPELVKMVKGNDASLSPSPIGTKFKNWTANSFRFAIDGIDSMQYVNKIDSFTIKQGIKKLYTGEGRFPQIEPTKIDFPTLTGTVSGEYAGALWDWHEDYVVKGKKDTTQQRTGHIQFLSQDRQTVLFQINLWNVGIHKMGHEASKANAETIKRVQFGFFVERMSLTFDAGIES